MVYLELHHSWVELVKTPSLLGVNTQWLVDAGDNADSIQVITNASERSTVQGGSGNDSFNISTVSKGLVEGGVGDDTIKVTGKGVTSASLKAGVGDDLMSITGGITDGSLFGGTGNDSFDFTGGKFTGLVDVGSGADSVYLDATEGDTVTLTGALTNTSLNAGGGADSILIKANMATASIVGGAAADTIDFVSSSVSAVATTIKGGAGADQVSLYGASDIVFDVASNDSSSVEQVQIPCSFTSSVVHASINAGSGNDSIVMSGTGMTGNTIDLGFGTDTIKFTETSTSDEVTVTNTTITGAKSLTFEKSASAAWYHDRCRC